MGAVLLASPKKPQPGAAGHDTLRSGHNVCELEPEHAYGMQMGVHCVWSNDSGTVIEALRLDFPDSFPPEFAEDDMHDTTPEVPIPCMAQLLEMEIRACEDAPATTCRCSCSPCIIAVRILQLDDPSWHRLMVGSVSALARMYPPQGPVMTMQVALRMLWCMSKAP